MSVPNGDWGWREKGIDNSDYDVTNDDEELEKTYKCDRCKIVFTLEEAASDFASHISGISYFSISEAGDLCGNCAAENYN